MVFFKLQLATLYKHLKIESVAPYVNVHLRELNRLCDVSTRIEGTVESEAYSFKFAMASRMYYIAAYQKQ